jgi:hypothetical protein
MKSRNLAEKMDGTETTKTWMKHNYIWNAHELKIVNIRFFWAHTVQPDVFSLVRYKLVGLEIPIGMLQRLVPVRTSNHQPQKVLIV